MGAVIWWLSFAVATYAVFRYMRAMYKPYEFSFTQGSLPRLFLVVLCYAYIISIGYIEFL